MYYKTDEQTDSGTRATMVVSDVIRMGRNRVRPPSTRASKVLIPPLRSCSTKVISTMALLSTIPTSISMPIAAEESRVRPVINRPSKAPIEARGKLTIMISGLRKERKKTAITA